MISGVNHPPVDTCLDCDGLTSRGAGKVLSVPTINGTYSLTYRPKEGGAATGCYWTTTGEDAEAEFYDHGWSPTNDTDCDEAATDTEGPEAMNIELQRFVRGWRLDVNVGRYYVGGVGDSGGPAGSSWFHIFRAEALRDRTAYCPDTVVSFPSNYWDVWTGGTEEWCYGVEDLYGHEGSATVTFCP